MSARSKDKSQLPATRTTADEHPGAAARALSEIIERGAWMLVCGGSGSRELALVLGPSAHGGLLRWA